MMVENGKTTGKELLFSVLRHEKTENVPWVPFAGVHAGKLKGFTAREVLTDGDKLLESLLEVNKLYRPDGQPVVFDLQVEAEILGCELLWAEEAPPSVITHPLSKEMSIPTAIPQADDGRQPLILEVMRKLKAECGRTHRPVWFDHRAFHPGLSFARHRDFHGYDRQGRLSEAIAGLHWQSCAADGPPVY